METSEETKMRNQDFTEKPENQKLDFHTELDLFFTNSPLNDQQKAKVEQFIAKAYDIGKNSKL